MPDRAVENVRRLIRMTVPGALGGGPREIRKNQAMLYYRLEDLIRRNEWYLDQVQRLNKRVSNIKTAVDLLPVLTGINEEMHSIRRTWRKCDGKTAAELAEWREARTVRVNIAFDALESLAPALIAVYAMFRLPDEMLRQFEPNVMIERAEGGQLRIWGVDQSGQEFEKYILQSDECSICLERYAAMPEDNARTDVNAGADDVIPHEVHRTECGHLFHFRCLKGVSLSILLLLLFYFISY